MTVPEQRCPHCLGTGADWNGYPCALCNGTGGKPPDFDWLGIALDNDIEALRRLSVYECPGCVDGTMVRYCHIHGLRGIAPR